MPCLRHLTATAQVMHTRQVETCSDSVGGGCRVRRCLRMDDHGGCRSYESGSMRRGI